MESSDQKNWGNILFIAAMKLLIMLANTIMTITLSSVV